MKKLCFVIMGYGRRTDFESGRTLDLDKTYLNIIKPAVESAGYQCIRGDEIQESGVIDRSMYGLLIHADLVIADITTYNPNAIYELGIRHAARPYSTIILKEQEGNIPFDLSHNKIFHYAHLGDDISATEAERCKNDLTNLINVTTISNEVDSPLFQYINSLTPYKLEEAEYNSLIKELSEKEKHIFALVEHAKAEMKANNFIEASKIWSKACKKVDNEPYFIQQHALCVYKSKNPSERTALIDALAIIKQLEPDGKSTNDPETLGITGAIYKRLWLIDNDLEYLNRAIDYYGKGFKINADYYTGENYALCLDFMSNENTNPEEKIYHKIEARKTREKIIEIIGAILDSDNYLQRIDLKWIYATNANCYLALNQIELFEEFENLFYQIADIDWEIETYKNSLEHIKKIKV
ncbi:TRAFs-binding domain-containing protein [Flavobacterium xinjiangense]|uniref:Uncharacterized protein n=1 Tax=Flavobacterium xinjiangense TaxID=178356 RepID=A0A1M7P6W2_9FLAO|nr:TRAFs-binding domain-containing protein [Flavobacterium xinjiangense]SHN12438.1 protein of unknown function [Flavobacterium xinjiangense]